MRRESADRDLAVALADRAEVADPTDVDHDFGLREPELHRGDQAVAAREHLRVLAVPGEEPERLLERRRPDIIERGGDHDRPPFSWIARQTRSGVNGRSRWRMPSGESASTTAFAIAGVAPIVPASPTPFTPSGFEGDGVSVLPSR